MKWDDDVRRVVIEYDGVRRRVELPFRICTSRENLETIRYAISRWLEREGSVFGWVDLMASSPVMLEGAPMAWKEGAE